MSLNRRPKVTIGLPVVADPFIATAIRSVFAQTESSWELLIVCDGSPADLVRELRKIRDPRVRVLPDERRLGLPTRLNQIAHLASGPLVARMDSDDVMHPDRIRCQLEALAEAKDVDVLGSASYLIDNDDVILGRYREPPLPDRPSGFLRSGVFSHPTVMYRTIWALRNPYDPRRVRIEDKELWLRASPHSRYEKLSEALLFCRVPRALSRSKQALTAKHDRKLLCEHGGSVGNCWQVSALYGKSLVKQAVFATLHQVGVGGLVHRTKYLPLSPGDLIKSEQALNAVQETPIPGWN